MFFSFRRVVARKGIHERTYYYAVQTAVHYLQVPIIGDQMKRLATSIVTAEGL